VPGEITTPAADVAHAHGAAPQLPA
jgi:hypothetical protein